MSDVFSALSPYYPLINFLIFLAVVYYFGKKPMQEMAKKQEEAFTDALAKAKELSDKAQAESKQLDLRMASLGQEIEAMMEEQRQMAHDSAQIIIKATESQAKRIHDELKHLARMEEDKVEGELRRNMLALVKERLLDQIEKNESPEQQKAYMARRISDMQEIKSIPQKKN